MRRTYTTHIAAGMVVALGLSLTAAFPATATPASRPRADNAPIPAIITTGPDKNLWFTNTRGGIDRLTPTGAVIEFPLPHAGSSPVGIAASGGALWFTETDGNRIGRITPVGAISEYALPTPGSVPAYITAGPANSLYFTETGANKIGRISATGTIHEFAVPTAKSKLGDIAAGPDGNLWFAEYASKKLGKMTPAGAITEFALPSGTAAPGFIITGPHGVLWFTAGGDISDTSSRPTIGRIGAGGQVTLFPLPKGAHPAGITVGPDGNLWVADSAGEILRVTTAGKASSFPLVQSSSAAQLPVSITLGPDGNLWFTAPALCFSGSCWSNIGRITPTGKITEFSLKHLRRA